ncbi:GAF domain-containing protein [Roseibium hamelinense]|uniref:GAF domain-containing protein n=1 Tax=Roseibium hamelinense TaxID=150831 RepID=A0A562TAK6_9HYPH|nr:GAF domain-containing protein [Roseibium hamelinense]MTI45204.1 GAF domain-containing protein [Roseibium hamelinense]TWI90433.1 GAF domain-containing protein [Roseibium hamelinense]
MSLPVPANEAERLKALHDLEILGTEAEPAFDALVEAAREIFKAPIALVSLVGEDQQWFKAKCGLSVDSTSRDLAFCAYTIMDDRITIVPDATKDPRFKDNALVTGDPNIRFYIGCPIALKQGEALGSLCVIDRVARMPTPHQVQQLKRLAVVLEGLLRAHHDVKNAERLLASARSDGPAA